MVLITISSGVPNDQRILYGMYGCIYCTGVPCTGFLLCFHNSCQLRLRLCLSCDYLSTNSVLRCMTVDYHIIFVPLFTQTFLQDSPSYSQVLPYVTTIWSSSVDINSDSLLFISTLNFAFQGTGVHGTIFIIYHMYIPCLRNSL